MATAQRAKTLYIDSASGTRYAYRKLGKQDGIPLIMHCHYRSNMDFWDPLLLNTIGATRPVIIFDQAGVGRSSGIAASTFAGWADHVIELVTTLGLARFDLLGFSMGGGTVQMVALKASQLVRKLILCGTFASLPGPHSDVSGIIWPRDQPDRKFITALSASAESTEAKDAVAYSFFYDNDEGRAHADLYWKRVLERNVPGEPLMTKLLDDENSARQMHAGLQWISEHVSTNSFDRLGELGMPVLVMNGDNDYLIPTSRSWELVTKIKDAQLIIYPKSGHGFLYQYAELVGTHINLSLNGVGGVGDAKL